MRVRVSARVMIRAGVRVMIGVGLGLELGVGVDYLVPLGRSIRLHLERRGAGGGASSRI